MRGGACLAEGVQIYTLTSPLGLRLRGCLRVRRIGHIVRQSVVCFEARLEFVSGPSIKTKYRYGHYIVTGMVIRA